MINKILRKVMTDRNRTMVGIHMTRDPECLWMHMYLDCENGQMTCDSAIGVYAYNWGKGWENESFISFCIRWFCNTELLLRTCVDEYNLPKKLNKSDTIRNIRERYIKMHPDDEEEEPCFDIDDIDGVLDVADSSYDDWDRFAASLCVAADERGVELPDKWWDCCVENYTTKQHMFAKICREVIAPELEKLILQR